jgi:hypothetical protein
MLYTQLSGVECVIIHISPDGRRTVAKEPTTVAKGPADGRLVVVPVPALESGDTHGTTVLRGHRESRL